MKQSMSTSLILAPKSVVPNWERELKENMQRHFPEVQITIIDSNMPMKQRLSFLHYIQNFSSYKCVIIMSHHLLLSMIEEISQLSWDCVVLDEGHIIKNTSTKLSKAMHRLQSPFRLLLSGTPIQNDFKELWALLQWAMQGTIVGKESEFRSKYADPIIKGQDPYATFNQRKMAGDARRALVGLIRPILLRRKKSDQCQEVLKLPEKKEIVLWIRLSTKQKQQYQEYINGSRFHTLMKQSHYPVEAMNTLKTICIHPLLLTSSNASTTPLEDDLDELDHALKTMTLHHQQEESSAVTTNHIIYCKNHFFEILKRIPTVEELLQFSTKLRVLTKMTVRLVRAGHRILIFSQMKRMLDIIQYLFIENGQSSYKIDGSTSSEERQFIIDDFNNLSEDYSGPRICLLTTKACGVGINLIGADRVIIFDPCKLKKDLSN
jgi:DNA excision repair protein ERCC-6-like